MKAMTGAFSALDLLAQNPETTDANTAIV